MMCEMRASLSRTALSRGARRDDESPSFDGADFDESLLFFSVVPFSTFPSIDGGHSRRVLTEHFTARGSFCSHSFIWKLYSTPSADTKTTNHSIAGVADVIYPSSYDIGASILFAVTNCHRLLRYSACLVVRAAAKLWN